MWTFFIIILVRLKIIHINLVNDSFFVIGHKRFIKFPLFSMMIISDIRN